MKGNFLAPAEMNRVYFVLSECLPGYRDLITAQGRALDLSERSVRTASAALDARSSQAADEHGRAEMWKADALEARGVTNSNTFWFSVGVGVGVAVAAILIYVDRRNP